MKISNIKNINYLPVYTQTAKERRVTPQLQYDSVSFKGNQITTFKKIASKTMQRLYNTNFAPSCKSYSEIMYPTFVFDKVTGKPIEVIVMPYRIDEICEEYHIFDPNRAMKKIGRRLFTYEKGEDSVISAGSMQSDYERYLGLGIRLHQIAIERMKMKGYKNIEIYSTAEAYHFHKKTGFEPFKEISTYSENGFKAFVKEGALSLGLDEEAVKKLIVYEPEFDTILIDCNATYGNYMDYMLNNLSKFEYGMLPYCAYMRISPEALAEWDKFIEKFPVLLDKDVPTLYLPGL